MKKEYKKPIVKYINYSYDEQVVAASDKIDGFGDGHEIRYCTYQSAAISNPCNEIVNKTFPTSICAVQPWSLRQ